jgi:hypothetical protein
MGLKIIRSRSLPRFVEVTIKVSKKLIASRTKLKKFTIQKEKKKFPAWFASVLYVETIANERARASAAKICGRAFLLPTCADHSIGRGFGGCKLTVPLADFFAFELGGRVENIRLFSSL